MDRRCLLFSDLNVFKKIHESVGSLYRFIHCTHYHFVHHAIQTNHISCVIFQVSKRSLIAPNHISTLKRYYPKIPFIAIIIDAHYEFIRFCGEIGIRHLILIDDVDSTLKKILEHVYHEYKITHLLRDFSIQSGDYSPIAWEILHLIEKNYLKFNSVQEIADYLGLPIYKITREIKKHMEIGPKKMLMLLKIRHAIGLMENDGYSMKEIAYFVGIEDQRRFNEIFHRFFGQSPTRCREAIRVTNGQCFWQEKIQMMIHAKSR